MIRVLAISIGLALTLPAAPAPAPAQEAEDAGSLTPSFREGDILGFEEVNKLRPFLPEPFWDNRDFFFYEGMRLEIGPTQRDYSPSEQYAAATEFYRGQPRIGPDSSLENWTAGRPFHPDEIDCTGDPQAGIKIMWDFQALGADGQAHFFYSYWDRGERLPLYYEGTGQRVQLAHRFEERHREMGGDIFRGEKRKFVFGVEVVAPFDARGIQLLSYRYKKSDGPRADARNDDTWVYVPTLRRGIVFGVSGIEGNETFVGFYNAHWGESDAAKHPHTLYRLLDRRFGPADLVKVIHDLFVGDRAVGCFYQGDRSAHIGVRLLSAGRALVCVSASPRPARCEQGEGEQCHRASERLKGCGFHGLGLQLSSSS